MGSLKVYATLAGMFAVATTMTTARAADLLPPPVMPEPYVEPIAAGGWYLRGDVGVSRYQGDKFTTPASPTAVFSSPDYGSGAFAGAGIGYQFNNWFRADVTGEYRFSTGFRVRDTDNFVSGGFPVVSHETTKGDYSAAVAMVNGYFDLGTWHGFTPFIGAGVGYAFHWTNGFQTDTLNVYPTLGITGTSGGVIRDKDRGDLAWAIHAGVAYEVTPNVKLEVAYRYMNLGEVRTGMVDCYCGATYQGFRTRELDSHDIKIGMRWAFGGAAVPAYEPAPLMRKY